MPAMLIRPYLGLFLTVLSVPAFADPELHWVSSGLNNRDITFSPDGNTLLTTIMSPKSQSASIAISHKTEGYWSALTIAPFSGEYQDIEPMFSPGGKQLFFASKRPKPNRNGTDWDIWRVDIVNGKWANPVNPGEPLNSEGDEFYPSIASNGNLYFTGTRDAGRGSEDIYRAIYEHGSYVRIENLGDGVNTRSYEFNAFVAPDESYLIFGSQGRAGEIGGGDLYLSVRRAGKFQSAVLLTNGINTKWLDYCPSVYNGRLYFTSERVSLPSGPVDISTLTSVFSSPGNGLGDIYSVRFEGPPASIAHPP
jgi:WD40-like Beta Propeller Repeat